MYSQNIQTVLEILKDEATGNVAGALSKTHSDYTMTWVYNSHRKELFPRTTMSNKSADEESLEDVYKIKGRKYEILNITENADVVMLELIESYPDPDTQEMYRTPLVLVLTFKDGKIITGRHYCDPQLSFMNLTEEQIDKAYVNKNIILTITE